MDIEIGADVGYFAQPACEQVGRLTVVADGTTITIADAPGRAVRILMVDAAGGRLVDLTIRRGPSGEG